MNRGKDIATKLDISKFHERLRSAYLLVTSNDKILLLGG